MRQLRKNTRGRLITLLGLYTLVVFGCSSYRVGGDNSTVIPSSSATQTNRDHQCLPEGQSSQILRTLSTGTQAEAEKAQQDLLSTSRKSTLCRAEVMGMLIQAMDKPIPGLQGG